MKTKILWRNGSHKLVIIPEKCLIYEVKFSMYDAIYIGNTQNTLRK